MFNTLSKFDQVYLVNDISISAGAGAGGAAAADHRSGGPRSTNISYRHRAPIAVTC